jgi:hypothetical protein
MDDPKAIPMIIICAPIETAHSSNPTLIIPEWHKIHQKKKQ